MKRFSISLILLVISAGQAVHANDMLYVGVSYGQTKYETDITSMTGTAKLDDETTSTKVLVGVNLGMGFIVEGYYADFGDVTFSANNGDTVTENGAVTTIPVDGYKMTSKYTGTGINAVYKIGLPLGSVYAKVGILAWEGEDETSVSGTVISTGTTSGEDALFGFGFELGVAPFTSVRLDHEQTEIDDADVTTTSLSLIVGF